MRFKVKSRISRDREDKSNENQLFLHIRRVIKMVRGLPIVYGGEPRGMVPITPNFSRGEVRGLQLN